VSKRQVHEFAGVKYVTKHGTKLVQSHTLENPFLPPEFYGVIRGQYSSMLAAQELAGDFVDVDGLMFRREWFRVVEHVPVEAQRVRYWDRAATAAGGDYSAGLLMARDYQGRYYIEDVVRGQWSFHARDAIIEATARRDAAKYNNSVVIYVEQEGGSGGKEAAEQAVIRLAGFPVYVDVVSGSRKRVKDKIKLPGEGKVVRAMPLAAQAEAGNVYVVDKASWSEDFYEEMLSFPEATHDDQVDACSGAFNKLAGSAGFYSTPIQRMEVTSQHVAESKYGVRFAESSARRNRFQGSE
jgi:predicted phage terminase large subunit-like protein